MLLNLSAISLPKVLWLHQVVISMTTFVPVIYGPVQFIPYMVLHYNNYVVSIINVFCIVTNLYLVKIQKRGAFSKEKVVGLFWEGYK